MLSKRRINIYAAVIGTLLAVASFWVAQHLGERPDVDDAPERTFGAQS